MGITFTSAAFFPALETNASDGSQSLSKKLKSAFRRPAAMCWIEQDKTIAVANSASGTISLVDVRTGQVSESALCDHPVDIAWLSQLKNIAVIDRTLNQLLLVNYSDHVLAIKQTFQLGRGANRLAVSHRQKHLAVGSLWDRAVSIIELNSLSESVYRIPLDFEPGTIVFVPNDSHLIVFDAFAGRFASVNLKQNRIGSTGHLQGHQIRGVEMLGNDRLVISHQILHKHAATSGDNIAAGAVIENVIQEIEFSTDSSSDLHLKPLLLKELGVPSHGAADPGSLALDENGDRYIALSGVDEVMFLNRYGIAGDRISVGRRPVELLLDDDNQKLYCLNQFDQSISIIDIKKRTVEGTISLGPLPESTSQRRGEEIFFDGQRSRFGWYSCQSCHVDGHTNGQLADTFGDGSAGAPKRILSLLGGRDNNPWAWNGSMRTLHDQVLKSGDTTMRGEKFSAREVNDVVAYLHTLSPPPPFKPPKNVQDRKFISSGEKVFHERGCSNCHIPPLTYTSDTMFDVGLTDEHGTKKFNPPSLIGVGYRRSYFHDGRAKSLNAVFEEYGHQLNESLSEDELAALIRFLESL